MSIFRSLLHLDTTGGFNYYKDLSFGDYIPLGYTPLEYIQSTGTQYIDTGVSPDTADIKIELKYQYLDNRGTGYDTIMGCHNGNNSNLFVSSLNGTSAERHTLGANANNLTTPYDTKIHTLIFNDENHECYKDGEFIGSVGTGFTTFNRNIYMFGNNGSGTLGNQSSGRIWYCKIWKNGNLVRSFKPCLRYDGTVGLYDTVDNIFYSNKGTGTFRYLYEVHYGELPDEYTPLDYVVATGVQYFNTGVDLWRTNNWITRATTSISEHYDYNNLIGYSNYNSSVNDISTNAAGNYYAKLNGVNLNNLYAVKLNEPFTMVHDNTGAKLVSMVNDEQSISNTTRVNAVGTNYPVSFGHRHGGSYFKGKLYDFKLWNDGRLVRSFVPCMNSAGEIGLYDLVAGGFYQSEGQLPFYTEEPVDDFVLPDEYTAIDYITSTGTQFINTGYNPTGNARYEIKVTKVTTSGVLYGAYNNKQWTQGNGLYTNAATSGYYYMHYYSNDNTSVTSLNSGVVIMDKGMVRINNAFYTSSNNKDFTVDYPLYLLAGNMSGTIEQPVSCRLYYFKIYDEGLVRDFIPVIKNDTQEAGLYDKVTGEFFGNFGTGEFEAAPIQDTITLPAEYQRLKGLIATGAQCINTQLTPTGTMEFEITFDIQNTFTSSGNFGTVFGSRTNYYQNGYHLTTFSMYTSAGHFLYGTNSNADNIRYEANMLKDGSTQTIIYHNSVLTGGNGNTTTINSQTFSNNYPIYLYALNEAGRICEHSQSTIYGCKFFDNGTLVRHFIPARRRADGVLGMYDMVEDIFYTNVGSGTFTAIEMGNTLPSEYTALEYIQSTGTEYIDMGLAPDTADFKMEIKYQYLSEHNTGSDAIAGARLGGEKTRLYICRNLNTTTVDRVVLGSTTRTYTHDVNPHVMIFNDENRDCYIDGILLDNLGTAYTPHANNMYLFAINYENEGVRFRTSARIWYCKVWKGGELVRDLVPCISDEGEVGLYDYVEGLFYTNAGTGSFRFAYPVTTSDLPKDYYELDYIIANGQQYLDTGVAMWETQNWAIEMKTAISEHYDWNNYLGYGAIENTTYESWANVQGNYYLRFGGFGKTQIGTATVNVPFTVFHDNTGSRLLSAWNGVPTHQPNTRATASGYTYPVWFGHRLGGTWFKGKIYRITIWKDNYLVSDLIPCASPDKIPGLYDRVTDSFLRSASGTEFITDQTLEKPENPGVVPDDYKVVAAITSNETQYINTGVIPTVRTGFDITYEVHDQFVTNDTLAGALFGARSDWWHDAYNLTTYSSSAYPQGHLLYGGMSSASGNANTIRHNAGMSQNTIETLSFRNGVLTKPDGTATTLSVGTGINTSYPIYIFGINQSGSFIEPSTMDLYELKFYEGDDLIRHFVPVVRKSDDVPGLYCLVTNQFYTNNGTGEFGIIENEIIMTSLDFEYTGEVQTATLEPGSYKLEVWGAQGGYNNVAAAAGRGGYATGNLTLTERTQVYVYVGGHGVAATTNTTEADGGFNGGGRARASNWGRASGGGASDIRIRTDSLYARVIVAGGGGGSTGLSNDMATESSGSAGHGGGLAGTSALAVNGTGQGFGTGGAQFAAGTNTTTPSAKGSFGLGGGTVSATTVAGGGGGWYGGAGGSGAGGGSGWVYTNLAYGTWAAGDAANAAQCLLASQYYLTNTQLLDGTAEFLSPEGSVIVGKSGHGHARITPLSVSDVPEDEFDPSDGDVTTETLLTYDYTGDVETVTLGAGTYQLEAWGASGANASTYLGGAGGYSTGTLILNQPTDLFIRVGQEGRTITSATHTIGNIAFNGGGAASIGSGNTSILGGGGGASDIRIGEDSLYSRVLVAGGGGGAAYYVYSTSTVGFPGGYGGGLTGGNGSYSSAGRYGLGGTQTGGGELPAGGSQEYATAGIFGVGGSMCKVSDKCFSGGAGGGGWYGGSSSSGAGASGGGGSGYYFDGNTIVNYPVGCKLTTAYYLVNGSTLNGNSTFSTPDKTTTETGHRGNGHVRITKLS